MPFLLTMHFACSEYFVVFLPYAFILSSVWNGVVVSGKEMATTCNFLNLAMPLEYLGAKCFLDKKINLFVP